MWLDGAAAETPWTLDGLNVVTGSAALGSGFRLRQEQCLEIAPVNATKYVVRPYLLDD